MTDHEPIVFESLDFIRIPVEIKGTGKFFLQEASGNAACEYRNATIACMKNLKDGKPTEIRGMGDLEPLLVSLCLVDEKGVRVPTKTIRDWPARIQKELFNKAKKISDLDESKEESGNDIDATMGGSD